MRFLADLEENIIALLLVSMTLFVFYETMMRSIGGHSFLWAEELTLHLSAWMVLLGASWALKKRAHIGVDAFVKLFPESVQRFFGIISVIGVLIYCGLIGYGSWIYLDTLHMIEVELEDIPMQKWIAHSVLVIGMGLLAIRVFQLFIKILKGQELGFSHHDESHDAMENESYQQQNLDKS